MPRCVAPGSTKFWTPHLSDSDDGLTNLIRDGWFSDTRPPNFNAWATALSSLGVTSIAVGRIASNLPVAGLMVLAALQFARRLPDQADFNSALLLPTLSLPPAMEAFVTCRSHFWQMAAQPVPISAHHSTCQNRNRPKA